MVLRAKRLPVLALAYSSACSGSFFAHALSSIEYSVMRLSVMPVTDAEWARLYPVRAQSTKPKSTRKGPSSGTNCTRMIGRHSVWVVQSGAWTWSFTFVW